VHEREWFAGVRTVKSVAGSSVGELKWPMLEFPLAPELSAPELPLAPELEANAPELSSAPERTNSPELNSAPEDSPTGEVPVSLHPASNRSTRAAPHTTAKPRSSSAPIPLVIIALAFIAHPPL
jgi:hypothetical protein